MTLYGVSQDSLLNAHQKILPKVPKTIVLYKNIKRLKKPSYQKKLIDAPLILVESVKAYESAFSLLNKCRGHTVIFDSPILLRQYENIQLLDVQNIEDSLKFNFDPKPLDYSNLIKATKKLSTVIEPRTRQKVDLLEEILKSYTVSGLLDKFNTYVYHNTSPLHRTAVKAALVQFIFGSINLEELKTKLAKYIPVSAKNTASLQPILIYMASPPGTSLQKALIHAQKMENEASKTSRRRIAYKAIAETYGVDSFELRNIILLYRAIK